MNEMKFIGLAGFATVGKDLFFSLLNHKYPCKRFSLADQLKLDIRQKLLDEHAIDVFNCNPEQKEMIRPHLVEYGTNKRKETEGRYWIEKLNKAIDQSQFIGEIPVITDIRYGFYEKDELSWLKDELDGKLVYIKKHFNLPGGNKEYVGPINTEEKVNDPKLRDSADFTVDWEHKLDLASDVYQDLEEHIQKFIDWYKKIN